MISNPLASTIDRKILKGTFWSGFQSAINGSFTFLINLLLAKLLMPEEFGLVGMAMVFVGLVQAFNELGISAALIQRKAEDLSGEHFYTAFWSGIIWSVIIYLLVWFFAAPFASIFYEEPRLTLLIRLMSLGLLINPLNLIHHALLTREMNFKKLAYISNVSKICAGIIALIMAISGAGVWSIVVNTVAAYAFALPLYFRATKWLPKFIWQRSAFNEVFGFGVYYTGTNVVNNLVSRLDYLLIGKILSANALGIYTFGFLLTDTLRGQLMAVMNKVMYPVYGKIQNDNVLIRRYYLTVVKYNSILIYPVMGFFIVLAEPFVIEFFGDKWRDSIPVLQILSLSVIFHMMVNSNTALIRGVGKPALELKIQFFKAIFLYFPSIFIGTYFYGIIGAAYAIVFNKAVSVVIAQYFLKKLFNITIKDLWNTINLPLLLLVAIVPIIYWLYEYLMVNYILCGIILFLLYFCSCYLFAKTEIKSFIASMRNVND